jgi:hypothetical protein
MNDFRIDIFSDGTGRRIRVAAECRSSAEVSELIDALKTVRLTFGRDAIVGKAKAGQEGGRARAEALSPERRSEIASNAANARWKS